MESHDEETLIAWRLEKVEQAVARVDKKLDDHLSMRTQIATLGIIVDGLVKSRDKQIAAMAVIGTSAFLSMIQAVFDVF